MITVIKDTREQNGFDLEFYGFNVINRKLDIGDYSIEGMEDLLSIERKASTAEIALNFGKKTKQFDAEITRMKNIKHVYLICEFTLDTLLKFPKDSGIPKNMLSKVRINANYLVSRIRKMEQEGIKVIFCQTKEEAERKVVEIIEQTYNEYKERS